MSDTLAYRDPEALREACEDADTLQEAAEEFDASYATVRRWLIKSGIHEPSTRETYGSVSRIRGESA